MMFSLTLVNSMDSPTYTFLNKKSLKVEHSIMLCIGIKIMLNYRMHLENCGYILAPN